MNDNSTKEIFSNAKKAKTEKLRECIFELETAFNKHWKILSSKLILNFMTEKERKKLKFEPISSAFAVLNIKDNGDADLGWIYCTHKQLKHGKNGTYETKSKTLSLQNDIIPAVKMLKKSDSEKESFGYSVYDKIYGLPSAYEELRAIVGEYKSLLYLYIRA